MSLCDVGYKCLGYKYPINKTSTFTFTYYNRMLYFIMVLYFSRSIVLYITQKCELKRSKEVAKKEVKTPALSLDVGPNLMKLLYQ